MSVWDYFCVTMAYNGLNYAKKTARIVEVYKSVKESDKPDSTIVAKIFPEHGIFISYRTWMNIKGKKPSEYNTSQLSLFSA